MKNLFAALLALCACAGPALAQPHAVLVTIDGFRWQEVFHGADPALVTTPQDKARYIDVVDRAAALTPFLQSLRTEGVLIVGSGMSFHNMRGYGDSNFTAPSEAFDHWLTAAAAADAGDRDGLLAAWSGAPSGRLSHPREEHLLPLMVASGASRSKGQRIYSERVMRTAISAFRFD